MPTTVNSKRASYASVGRAFKLPDFNLDVSHRAHVGYYLFEQGRPQLEQVHRLPAARRGRAAAWDATTIPPWSI